MDEILRQKLEKQIVEILSNAKYNERTGANWRQKTDDSLRVSMATKAQNLLQTYYVNDIASIRPHFQHLQKCPCRGHAVWQQVKLSWNAVTHRLNDELRVLRGGTKKVHIG